MNQKTWLLVGSAGVVGLVAGIGIAYLALVVFARENSVTSQNDAQTVVEKTDTATDFGGWQYTIDKDPLTDEVHHVRCILHDRRYADSLAYLFVGMSGSHFGININSGSWSNSQRKEGTVTCKIRFDDKPHTIMVFTTPVNRSGVIFQDPREALAQLLTSNLFAIEMPDDNGITSTTAVFELRGLANCIRRMEADTGIKIIDAPSWNSTVVK